MTSTEKLIDSGEDDENMDEGSPPPTDDGMYCVVRRLHTFILSLIYSELTMWLLLKSQHVKVHK